MSYPKPKRPVTTNYLVSDLGRFPQVYRRFSSYVGTELWDILSHVVATKDLISPVVFCNDVLEIPPALVFINLSEKGYLSNGLGELQDFDKRFIGAFWGFVFKELLGYNGQKQVRTGHKVIRNATYFFDCDDQIIIKRG